MRWPLWRLTVTEQSMAPALGPGDWLLVHPGRAARPAVGSSRARL